MKSLNVYGRDFDLDSLKKSKILKDEEVEIFERNIKLMKLDEIYNHPIEINWYEEQINQTTESNKELFKSLIKQLELWNIYRKINEWFTAFQKKENIKKPKINDYFDIFNAAQGLCGKEV